MNRREVIAIFTGATVAWPIAAGAQQKAVSVVGILSSHWPNPDWNPTSSPVPQGLSESGYVAGQNMSFERRWAEGHYDRLPALAAELVHRNVHLIVTFGGTPPALAAKGATATIPIVFTGATDPVAAGLVTSLARPGGNVTGFSVITSELAPKRLDLISELVPQAGVIAMLVNPNNPTTELLIRDVQDAARVKGIRLSILKATTESEIDAAFASLAQLQPGALIVDADSVFTSPSGVSSS
jgi:putative ABC transport system substrate-binding protein